MQALRQLGGGLLLGLLSVTILLGGMSLALAEGYVPPPRSTFTETQTTNPLTPAATFTLVFGFTPTPTPSETSSASPIPPANCPSPNGWRLVIVQSGETLEILAARYKTTPQALSTANCLVSPSILPGYGLYVPPSPASTAIPCGAPFGWVQYTVQSGENLYRISQLYRITVPELQQANCLGSSTTIYTGQRLWVPNVATSTPPATPINIEFATVTPMPTETASATNTFEPTATPTSSATPTPPAER